jgi:hypothetical protein
MPSIDQNNGFSFWFYCFLLVSVNEREKDLLMYMHVCEKEIEVMDVDIFGRHEDTSRSTFKMEVLYSCERFWRHYTSVVDGNVE